MYEYHRSESVKVMEDVWEKDMGMPETWKEVRAILFPRDDTAIFV